MQTDMDVFNEDNKMDSTIKVDFKQKNPKISLYIETQLMSLDIEILQGKTATISVWDDEVGEVVYDYHNHFNNLEDLKQVIIKAFSYIKI